MRHALVLLILVAAGCGAASTARPATHARGPRTVVEMEEMRITARRTEGGELEFTSYDAEMLFRRAMRAVEEGRCVDEGAALYDRVADEFPSSRFASPALYNAGLCLHEAGQRDAAVLRYERILRHMPGAPDVKHATFQLAQLYVELERWDDAIGAADGLLGRSDLDSDERMEAMARRAQALLGAERIADAASQADSALSFERTRPEGARVRDNYFTAAANFVLAETFRKRAEAIHVPTGQVEEQRAVLEQRARFILDAQREYFDTIRHTNAHWAAASGYQIGAMYDAFWTAIMSAPVPPPRSQMNAAERAVYDEEYRLELARLVKPLIRHSIRYWELTLMMIERTGVESEWTARIHEDLSRARERLLQQPAGRGGIPAPGTAPPTGDAPPATQPPASTASAPSGGAG